MKPILPPRRLNKEQIEGFPINLLVGHVYSHEEYARKMLSKEKYEKYHEMYLSELYCIGHRRDTDGFALELAIARVDQIPFVYKMKQNKKFAVPLLKKGKKDDRSSERLR